MDPIAALLAGIALGAVLMYAVLAIHDQITSDRAAQRRSHRRRVLGLEDRPDRRTGAVGTARVRTANVQSDVRGE